MKFFAPALLLLIALCCPAHAAQQGYVSITEQFYKGDTIPLVEMYPIFVNRFKKKADLRQYQRLIYNLKRVYPIAKHANALLQQTEAKMEGMSRGEQKKYIKQFEQDLKTAYEPVLRKMTFSQGKLLIKLIDRETDRTSYELVKELRGSFRAFFWQGIARIFGANLKDTYDMKGEDAIIEQLIMYYEAGLL